MPESFRERVDVTSIIRSILDSYPLGNGILRELLQNSDDAGATEQTFILDLQTHPSQSLVDPDLVDSQGPSLLAVNNSLFTDRDWTAIRTIHNSSKTEDETKIGKFGIGVRACYHITDNPHFLSGSKLGIFDPHDRFSQNHAGGVQIDVVEEGAAYCDQLAPFKRFLGGSIGGFSGTVVRLPLRTPQQAPKSTIKQIAVDASEIEKLFHDFVEKELSIVMLFLKHIRSISLVIINTKGVETFIGSADIPDSTISEKRTFLRHGDAREETFRCTVNIKASRDGPSTSKLWRVYHTVQSTEETTSILNNRLGYDIDPKLLVKDKLFSHVALAFPIDHAGVFDGRLFTLLPLPILTGFPIHVHAILALTQDRQSLRNIEEVGMSPNSRERLLVTWNRSIFNDFLPRAWCGLLHILVEMNEIRDVWSVWPKSEHVNDYWKQILPNVMDRVLDSNLPIFPTFPGAKIYVSPSSALIASSHDDKPVLRSLSRLGLAIVQPPRHIQIALGSKSNSSTFLHPNSVREALLNCIPSLSELADKDKDRILGYLVLAPGIVSNAVGLPLVPLVNGSRIALSQGSGKIYVLVTKSEEEVFGDLDVDMIALSKMTTAVSAAFCSSKDVNTACLDAAKVHSYLDTAFGSFDPAHGVGDKIEWLTRFWNWMFQSTWPDKNGFLSLINELPLLPTDQGTLRTMRSRIILPISDHPSAMTAWSTLGVQFLHPRFIPYQPAFQHATVQAGDIAFLVDTISPQLIPNLDENSAKLIQNYVVQHVSSLETYLQQDASKRAAFMRKFLRLSIFPIRMAVQTHGNQLSAIKFSEVSSALVYICGNDQCPVPTVKDQAFFDVTHSSGVLGAIIDPVGHGNPLDELGVLEMAINHLEMQAPHNLDALLSRIVRRLPDISSSAKGKLQTVPFVPTLGGSQKLPPNQVIDPGSELADIYKGEAGKFPDGLWSTDHLPILTSQGFFLRELKPEIALERIIYLSSTRWAKDQFPSIFYKAKMFLMLLSRRWNSVSQALDISNHLTAEWLPINKDCDTLVAPIKYPGRQRFTLFIHNPHLREALGWAEIPIQVLQSQFDQTLILDCGRNRTTRIYSLIKEFTRRLPKLSAEDIDSLKTLVFNIPWVPTSGNADTVQTKYALLRASRLSLTSRFHLVPHDLVDGQGRWFLERMGCSDSPSLEVLLTELELISTERSSDNQTKSQQALDILKEIEPLIPTCTSDDYSRILVPGFDGVLHPAAQVYFMDNPMSEFRPPTLRPVDSGMSRSLACKLQLRFQSSLELESAIEDFDDIQMGENFTKRVEGVLKEHGIHHALNEYLANAVDAKATEFSVILDERTNFGDAKVISPQLAELQRKPSMLLYNNAVFTPDDFRGLRMIGEGGKGSDPDTIGRRYPDQLACFDSVYGFSKFSTYYKGTLFRLPLRTKSSEISQTALSITTCLNLLNGPYIGLARDAMFFTCLEHVSAQQRPQTGSDTPIWSVSASREGTTMAGENYHREILSLKLAVEQPSTTSFQSWLVTRSSTPLDCVPSEHDDVLVAMKRHGSKVGLVVRMAFLLEQKGNEELPSHYLFSSMRLPVHTSLPAHIHAQFCLSSDRRHIRFDALADGSGFLTPQAAFNNWLLQHLVAPLYISSIPCVVELHSNKNPIVWWPTLGGSDEISRTIIHAFYRLLPTSNVPICYSVTSYPIAPNDATFCGKETPLAIIRVLHVLGSHDLVHLDRQEIYELVFHAPPSGTVRPQSLDPSFVQKYVRSRGAGLGAFLTNKAINAEDINDVLLFLLEGGIPVAGLPLFIQADNTLVSVGGDGPVKFVTPRRLLPMATQVFPRDRFLQVPQKARELLLKRTDVNIISFDQTGVLKLVEERIPPMQSPCIHSSADIEWIAKFWQFYDRLPGPPDPSSFDALPLIRTTKGEYISPQYCRRDNVLSEPTATNLMAPLEKMGVVFYHSPLPAPLQESYLKPGIALAKYSVSLETVIGWSPMRRPMSSTELLRDIDMAGYARLLQEFLSLQDGGDWQLPVPDMDRVLRPANHLYDHTEPLFFRNPPLGKTPRRALFASLLQGFAYAASVQGFELHDQFGHILFILFGENTEEVAWTQRGLFPEEPPPNPVLFNALEPSLGVPNAKEVVDHLAVLALKIAPECPRNSTLLKHLRATYKWLNENSETAREALLLRSTEPLFLNVDNPDTEAWEWRPAEQLFFNIDYDWESTFRVRQFLLDYRPLLLAAGGDSEDPVDYRPQTKAKDGDILRDAFDAMRKAGKLTDMLQPSPTVRDGLDWREGRLQEYSFPGTYFGARAVLDFIYTGRIERNLGGDVEARMTFLRDILELLDVAEQWDMPELKDEIGRLVKDWDLLSRATYQMIIKAAQECQGHLAFDLLPDWGAKNPKSVTWKQDGEMA
ncbi:hypothetical protein B0H11DRAFT_1915714 [Mycena galericulata]|nr:hypothetical protein B0H11DRAFT_1915714 [Mycena galericulata]